MNIEEFKQQINEYVDQIKKDIISSLESSLKPEEIKDLIKSRDITSHIYTHLITEFFAKDINSIDTESIGKCTNDITQFLINEVKNQKPLEVPKAIVNPFKLHKLNLKNVFEKHNANIKLQLNKYNSQIAEISEAIDVQAEEFKSSIESQPVADVNTSSEILDISLEFNPIINSEIVSSDESNESQIININRESSLKHLKSFNALIKSKSDKFASRVANFKEHMNLINKLHNTRFGNLAAAGANLIKNLKNAKGFDVGGFIKDSLRDYTQSSIIINRLRKFKFIRNAIARSLKLLRKFPAIRKGISILKKIKGIKGLFRKTLTEIGKNIIKKSKLLTGIVSKYTSLLNFKNSILSKSKGLVTKLVARANKAILKVIGKLGIKTLSKGMKVIGKVIGKFSKVLKPIPFIGSMISGWFAYQRYKEGDYAGAVLEVIAAALKFAPGPWAVLGWAIDAGLMAKDFGLIEGKNIPIIGALYRWSDAIKFILEGKWKEALKEIFKASLHLFLGPLGMLTDKVAEHIKTAFNKGIEYAKRLKEFVVEKWDELKNWTKDRVEDAKTAYQDAKVVVKEKVIHVRETVTQKAESISRIIVDVKQDYQDAVNTVVSDLQSTYNESIQKMRDYYAQHIEELGLKEKFKQIENNVVEVRDSLKLSEKMIRENTLNVLPSVEVPLIKEIQQQEKAQQSEEYSYLMNGELPVTETIDTRTTQLTKEYEVPVNEQLRDSLSETLINLKILKTSLNLKS